MTTVFFEAVAVSWVYGLNNFSDDVFSMLGHRPGLYWRITWKFISPTFLAVSGPLAYKALLFFVKVEVLDTCLQNTLI